MTSRAGDWRVDATGRQLLQPWKNGGHDPGDMAGSGGAACLNLPGALVRTELLQEALPGHLGILAVRKALLYP